MTMRQEDKLEDPQKRKTLKNLGAVGALYAIASGAVSGVLGAQECLSDYSEGENQGPFEDDNSVYRGEVNMHFVDMDGEPTNVGEAYLEESDVQDTDICKSDPIDTLSMTPQNGSARPELQDTEYSVDVEDGEVQNIVFHGEGYPETQEDMPVSGDITAWDNDTFSAGRAWSEYHEPDEGFYVVVDQ